MQSLAGRKTWARPGTFAYLAAGPRTAIPARRAGTGACPYQRQGPALAVLTLNTYYFPDAVQAVVLDRNVCRPTFTVGAAPVPAHLKAPTEVRLARVFRPVHGVKMESGAFTPL